MTRRTLLTAPAALAAQSTKAAGKVNIGIVGGGFGSGFQWHLDPDCTVGAVCDIRPDRLQRLSEVYRCGNTFKDFRATDVAPQSGRIANPESDSKGRQMA